MLSGGKRKARPPEELLFVDSGCSSLTRRVEFIRATERNGGDSDLFTTLYVRTGDVRKARASPNSSTEEVRLSAKGTPKEHKADTEDRPVECVHDKLLKKHFRVRA